MLDPKLRVSVIMQTEKSLNICHSQFVYGDFNLFFLTLVFLQSRYLVQVMFLNWARLVKAKVHHCTNKSKQVLS